jgi:hypothetical protein
LADLFLPPLFGTLLVGGARWLFTSLLFPTLLSFLTRLLLLPALFFKALLPFHVSLLALLLAILIGLAGLRSFLLALLLALLALSLVLLATLLAATTSALSIGETARAQQRRCDPHGRCRSCQKFSVH